MSLREPFGVQSGAEPWLSIARDDDRGDVRRGRLPRGPSGDSFTRTFVMRRATATALNVAVQPRKPAADRDRDPGLCPASVSLPSAQPSSSSRSAARRGTDAHHDRSPPPPSPPRPVALDAPHLVDEASGAGVDHTYGGDYPYVVGGGVCDVRLRRRWGADLYLAGGADPAALYRNRSGSAGLAFRASAAH